MEIEDKRISWRRLALFLAIAFVPVWILVWLPEWLTGEQKALITQWVWSACMLFPAAAAFLVPAVFRNGHASYKQNILSYGLNFKGWWFILLGWGLPVILGFAALGITLLLGWGTYDPSGSALLAEYQSIIPADQYSQMAEQSQKPAFMIMVFMQTLIIGSLFNSIFTFGEEFGWRGFLQTELSFTGYWTSSLLVGAIWGIWHIPFIIQGHNYPGQPLWGTVMMIGFCVLTSLLLGYFRLRSGSVFPAVIYHATVNASVGLFLMLSGNPDRMLGPVLGAAGFIAMALALGFFILVDFRFFFPQTVKET